MTKAIETDTDLYIYKNIIFHKVLNLIPQFWIRHREFHLSFINGKIVNKSKENVQNKKMVL